MAKIAGIKMCEAYNRQYGTQFVSVMPTNLYGPNDNFDLENSHVLPALIRKFHEAKSAWTIKVVVWGTGSPRREFLYVDDMAAACVFVMNRDGYTDMVNIGWEKIFGLAIWRGWSVRWSGLRVKSCSIPGKPDGTPQKLLDVGRLKSWLVRANRVARGD